MELTEYQPRAGVDYIVDYYALADVPYDAPPEDIRQALRRKMLQFHPDRLQGLAPHFQEEGLIVTQELGNALHILMDDEHRAHYDEILGNWGHDISADGMPTILIEDDMRIQSERQHPEQIEAFFAEIDRQYSKAANYDPGRVHAAEQLLTILEASGTVEPKTIAMQRDQLGAALLAEDRLLAASEENRATLLGVPNISNLNEISQGVMPGYSRVMTRELNAARRAQRNELHRRAIGGASVRLAILSGQAAAETEAALQPLAVDTIQLPAYFDDQAERLQQIASKREAILSRRLELLQPEYPNADLQSELCDYALIGMRYHKGKDRLWFEMRVDPESNRQQVSPLKDPSVLGMLKTSNYRELIQEGRNIFTFTMLSDVELAAQVDAVVKKHQARYATNKD